MLSEDAPQRVLSELKACEASNDSLGFISVLKTELGELQEPSDALSTFSVIQDYLTAAVYTETAEDFKEAVLSDMFSVIISFTATASMWPTSKSILVAAVDTVRPRELATMIADCLSRAG